jgi:hypothetical protein
MRVTRTLIPMGLAVLLAGCFGSDAPDSAEPEQTPAKSVSLSTADDGFGADDPALATRVSKFNLLPLPAGWQGSVGADIDDPRVIKEVITSRFDPESFRSTKELRLWMGGKP